MPSAQFVLDVTYGIQCLRFDHKKGELKPRENMNNNTWEDKFGPTKPVLSNC